MGVPAGPPTQQENDMSTNTKRRITFRVDVVADDHDAIPLDDVAQFAVDSLIDTISSEGWEIVELPTPKISSPWKK